MVDSNYIGCYGELLFFSECIKRGYNVSRPLLDSSVYDCVVDRDNVLYKVQVKSSIKTPRDDDPNIHVPLQNNKKKYEVDLVDYFAVYSTFYGGFFIFKNLGEMKAIRISLSGKWKDCFNNYNFNKEDGDLL